MPTKTVILFYIEVKAKCAVSFGLYSITVVGYIKS